MTQTSDRAEYFEKQAALEEQKADDLPLDQRARALERAEQWRELAEQARALKEERDRWERLQADDGTSNASADTGSERG